MAGITRAKQQTPAKTSEKDASEMWCPHVRYPYEIAKEVWIVVNRIPGEDVPEWARCITSKCPYWERTYDIEQRAWVGKCSYG